MPAAPIPAAAIANTYPLFTTLEAARKSLTENEWGTWGGIHDLDHDADLNCTYGKDAEGEYALIGFVLPDGFYAEHATGYSTLIGFRIYRDDL